MRLVLALFLSSCLLAAQDTNKNQPASVLVHGEATVSATPDQAEIDIGVTSQGTTAKAASDQNAKVATAVVEALERLLHASDIKTINFSVNPNYRYPKDGGTPEVMGYTANNAVRLVLNDLSRIQEVIDTATHAGANSINRLNFTLKDEKSVRARALANAATQASAGAEALAAALHLKLGRLIRVEEGQPVIVSPARQIEMSVAKAESTSMTPVSPGNIEIHANVNLTYALVE